MLYPYSLFHIFLAVSGSMFAAFAAFRQMCIRDSISTRFRLQYYLIQLNHISLLKFQVFHWEIHSVNVTPQTLVP